MVRPTISSQGGVRHCPGRPGRRNRACERPHAGADVGRPRAEARRARFGVTAVAQVVGVQDAPQRRPLAGAVRLAGVEDARGDELSPAALLQLPAAARPQQEPAQLAEALRVAPQPLLAVCAHLCAPEVAGLGVEGPVLCKGCVHFGADRGRPVCRGEVAKVVQTYVQHLAYLPAQAATKEEK